MKYPSTSVTKKHRNDVQGKECFMKKHLEFFQEKPLSPLDNCTCEQAMWRHEMDGT